MTLLECLSGDLPYGDEAPWDTRRRWPIVHRRLPETPEVPDLIGVLRPLTRS